MGVSLSKGGNISLSKEAGSAGLAKLTIGLGWDVRATDGAKFDLDASAFVLGANGKTRSDADFIFYQQPGNVFTGVYPNCKPVVDQCFVYSTGDNTDGGAEGDDEQIKVDLTKVPADVQKISVAVTIHEADTRRQNFGMVTNACIRIVNDADGKELTKFDLGEDFSTETAVIFGELYRNNNEWKFKAIGQGFAGGLGPLARNFGVNV
jgi:tellurium resistance protein TerD